MLVCPIVGLLDVADLNMGGSLRSMKASCQGVHSGIGVWFVPRRQQAVLERRVVQSCLGCAKIIRQCFSAKGENLVCPIQERENMDFDKVMQAAKLVLEGKQNPESLTEGKVSREAFAKLTKFIVPDVSEMTAMRIVLDYKNESGEVVAQLVFRKGKEDAMYYRGKSVGVDSQEESTSGELGEAAGKKWSPGDDVLIFARAGGQLPNDFAALDVAEYRVFGLAKRVDPDAELKKDGMKRYSLIDKSAKSAFMDAAKKEGWTVDGMSSVYTVTVTGIGPRGASLK